MQEGKAAAIVNAGLQAAGADFAAHAGEAGQLEGRECQPFDRDPEPPGAKAVYVPVAYLPAHSQSFKYSD